MSIYSKILVLLFCSISLFAKATKCNLTGFELAQDVLDKLYQVSGQYIYEKPALELSPENERVAGYSPSKNLITIDEKALSICLSMGSEAQNALAFLIGHELAHAFQKEVRQQDETTHFLSYNYKYHSLVRTEKVADVQGVFAGYLAKYGMQKAIPVVLEKLYNEYGLAGKILRNYPTYEERLQSAKEVVALVEELIDLYEANQYLLALDQYKLASNTLEHILEYYQGFEIQNNIGVTYLYSAIEEIIDPETDQYAYPIRLDASSQLAKIDLSRGGKLNYMERKLRNNILNAALNYFEKSIELNPNYFIAKINKACVLNQLLQQDKAKAYLNSKLFNDKEKSLPEYQLVLGITEALSNNSFRATNIFNEISKCGIPIPAAQGQFNLDILKGRKKERLEHKEIEIPSLLIKYIDGLKLGSTKDWHEIILNTEEELVCKTIMTKTQKSLSFCSGFNSLFSIVFSTQLADNLSLFDKNADLSSYYSQNIIVAGNCFYLNFKKEKIIIKCDQKGKVLRLGRYY